MTMVLKSSKGEYTDMKISRTDFNEVSAKIYDICQLFLTTGSVEDSNTEALVTVLNKIFTGKQCVTVIVTDNHDNIPFGIHVSPTITNIDLMTILVDTEEFSFDRYTVEIDSKLINTVQDHDMITAYLLDTIAGIVDPETVTTLRAIIDVTLNTTGTTINIKQSANYNAILIYGIKNMIRKIVNCSDKVYVESDEEYDIKELLGALTYKINNIDSWAEIEAGNPKMSVLAWVLLVYTNLDTEYKDAVDTLTNARPLTGSELERAEIDKCIKSLRRASSEALTESVLLEFKGLGLFRTLKQNGLRGLEDDLYEYKVRVKNVQDQADAIYIMRCINSRLSILEDYLMTEPNLKESDRARWQGVIDAYRALRVELSKKRFLDADKNFNAFLNFDYSKLDALDKEDSSALGY